ncbi:hypothetical protein [Mixta mediterraneensis]|uniref:hypothetical protein n=1 Tax=Mixta mediterraneensis TaxID=2758443 RepID=UPI001876F164|nr:hypothetical protein [Mixta mediterraneensis]
MSKSQPKSRATEQPVQLSLPFSFSTIVNSDAEAQFVLYALKKPVSTAKPSAIYCDVHNARVRHALAGTVLSANTAARVITAACVTNSLRYLSQSNATWMRVENAKYHGRAANIFG